jgi:nucleoside triphosphatase
MRDERTPEVVVGALLVDGQSRVFLARFSKAREHYVVPGGHVEYGETIGAALVREMQEETGLTPTRYRLLRVGERIRPKLYKDGAHHLVYLDFLVEAWTGDLRLDENELSGGVWLAPEMALDLPLAYTTEQLVRFYLEHRDDERCDYQVGAVD